MTDKASSVSPSYDEANNPPEGENLVEWLRWLDGRPEVVRRVVALMPPWKTYRLRGSPVLEDYRIVAYSEHKDGSVTLRCAVVKTPLFEREVFGLKPGDLEAVA